LSPPQHDRQLPRHQEGAKSPSRGSWRRPRRCLLKGCEDSFSPHHPLCRYCSPLCKQAARHWSEWRAGRRYRCSEQGRKCRQEQSRRRRQRVKQREKATRLAEQAEREGHPKSPPEKYFSCARPGCYELFHRTARNPRQKFCSFLCRKALRTVLVREARWHRRCHSTTPCQAIPPSPSP